MTTTAFGRSLGTEVGKEATQMMWWGAALLLVGIAAVAFPFYSTFVATLFVGWTFVISGVVMLFGAFTIRGAGPFFGALLLALLSIAAGVFLLARPGSGELAVTLTLGALFMVQGAFEVALAFALRPQRGWGWMLASAAASVVLAVAILAGWPGSSLYALGVVLGVNFISSGLACLMIGAAAKQEARA